MKAHLKTKSLPLTLLLLSTASYSEVRPSELAIHIDNVSQEVFVNKQLENEAKEKIKVFSTTLKQALVGAIQTGGFENGVNVCKEQAPQIAKNLSTGGWQVSRTSLKVRNTDNQPSDWERESLNQFDALFKQGVPAGKLETSQQTQDTFSYMKAIPTGQICLVCHGVSVDKTLQQTITTQYPEDVATGFRLGDIRGAFSLTKSITE
ncbi:DUF3365 domain-containing protein [Paraglaciecola sp. 2405UD69-4]|uniref:Tll0287-like domain-containing protein n=1 Tax=Paraglaciecola sp. 2405UD69-4 TaxID=3391836 RepID=UPI0039C9916E